LAEHILWLSLLTLIMARGLGAISLDHLVWNSRLSIPEIAHRSSLIAFLKNKAADPLGAAPILLLKVRCLFAIASRD